MRSPWPEHGHVNRNYGHPGERGDGRSGPPFTGQTNYNSYMEAEDGRSRTRPSFPVLEGDWKTFEKNCLAEAHVAGVNEAITVARKSYNKNWDWPFATDPRWEPLISSDNEAENSETETESSEMQEQRLSRKSPNLHLNGNDSRWRLQRLLTTRAKYYTATLTEPWTECTESTYNPSL